MRVLIVKVSALGDIIHALPVLDYLNQVAPGIEIDWVVEEQSRELLDGHPLINNLISINTKKWRHSPFAVETRREIFEVISFLRSATYDLVFDIQGNIKSGIICRLSGADRRYGFARNGVRESLNLLFNNHHVQLLADDHHVSRRALRVISAAFDLDPGTIDLHTSIATYAEDDLFAEELINKPKADPVLLFHNGTSWQTKLWHTDAWIELGTLITQHYPAATILLSWGSEDELATAKAVAHGIGAAATVLPSLSLKRFCAVLKRVNLVVGGDTGPIHLAAALSTPTVSFYRATDPLRNAPIGIKHLHVSTNLECRACLKKKCDRDEECRSSISARSVFEAVERFIP